MELTLLHGNIDTPVDPTSVIGLGATVQIELPTENEAQEYFGIISELHQVGWSDQGITYRATMVPSLWFLTQRNNCRIFQDMKTPEIVEQVLLDAGIKDFEFNLMADYTKREYCVQYRETDFNFVSRLLEEEGLYYYFEHKNGKNNLVFCDSDHHYYDLETPKVNFPKPGLHFPNKKELLTWDERFQFIPGSFSQKDFNFEQPTTDLYRKRPSTVSLPNNQNCEFYDFHGRYSDASTGTHLTDMRMGEAETNYHTGFATSEIAYMHPAGKFKFGVHCFEARQGSEYTVTAIDFEARAADYVTGDQSEEDQNYRNKFTCIPSDRAFRPARRAVRPFVQGPQTAIVTTDGDEIMVDEHARVKVHFHWDRYNQFDDTSSCWIRVSQVHAGEGFGMMDIPRRNEEVIVSFIEGDPDRPIITGRVYNGANRPPYDLGEGQNGTNKTRRGNASKTVGKDTNSYNEMTMDDTPGKEQVRINSQYNMDTNVNNNQTLNVGVDRSGTIGNDDSLTVGNDQKNTIANDQTNAVGNNRSTAVANDHSESVGSNQSVVVGSNQTTSVGSNQTETVGANRTVTVASNETMGVGVVRTVGVGMLTTHTTALVEMRNAGLVENINAGVMTVVSAGVQLQLIGPGGQITIGPSGIHIKGKMVTIEGGVVNINP